MKLKKGDVLRATEDVLVFTANSYINASGRLVMGRGAAKSFSIARPELPLLAGNRVTEFCGHLGVYGFLMITRTVGAFQVKRSFREEASLGLITYACRRLDEWAIVAGVTVGMNFPGIVNGWLERDQVEPVIRRYLGDRIVVYYL